MSILILGCGPAGLLCAWAAVQRGYQDITIVSKEAKPSVLGGAQYMHAPIPDLTKPEPETIITVYKMGDGQTYAEKVYGDPEAPVSWNRYEAGEVPGWNLFKMYDRLWDAFDADIDEQVMGPEPLDAACGFYDTIISTIPRKALCYNPDHSFNVRQVWVLPGNEEEGGDFIEYNGVPNISWYRTSRLFGARMTEWSTTLDNKPHPDAYLVPKPIATDCDCWEGAVKFIGRYGEWKKSQLVSHAWEQANEVL